MNNLNRTAIIPKIFFLAETFYRYKVRIFRDHETLAAGYRVGVSMPR
jgi:hypothetical protein